MASTAIVRPAEIGNWLPQCVNGVEYTVFSKGIGAAGCVVGRVGGTIHGRQFHVV